MQKYLGFPLPEHLMSKVTELISAIKASDNKRQYALPIYDIIVELSDIGLDYYFIQPLNRAKLGRIKIKLIAGTINTGKKAIMRVGKSIVKGMNDEQLMVVIKLFEDSLTVRQEDLES